MNETTITNETENQLAASAASQFQKGMQLVSRFKFDRARISVNLGCFID
jgi:hypothetical protein